MTIYNEIKVIPFLNWYFIDSFTQNYFIFANNINFIVIRFDIFVIFIFENNEVVWITCKKELW